MSLIAVAQIGPECGMLEELQKAKRWIIGKLLEPLVFPVRVVARAMFESSVAQDQVNEARMKALMLGSYPRF